MENDTINIKTICEAKKSVQICVISGKKFAKHKLSFLMQREASELKKAKIYVS